jgi:hypothetical protein
VASNFGDGASNDLPWASVFDPAANARALSAIQAEGFELPANLSTASSASRQSVSTAVKRPRHRQPDRRMRPSRPVRCHRHRTLGQVVVGHDRSVLTGSVAPHPGWDCGGHRNVGSVERRGQRPTGSRGHIAGAAKAEVWLHNTGANDLGQVKLRCGDLLARDGGVTASDTVTFSPAAVAMPGGRVRASN